MVSASKMRRAQAQALATRPYTQALQESLQQLAAFVKGSVHPYLEEHKQGFPVALIISTDKGLCGGLNQNLFKVVLQWLKQHPTGKIVVIGRKAIGFARVYGLPTYAQFSDLPDPIKPSDTIQVSTLASKGFLEKTFTSVDIIYMDFISTLVQRVATVQLLPLPKNLAHGPVQQEAIVKSAAQPQYIFEPSAAELLQDLLNYYLENSVYQAFLEGKASEHSARMVAMKNASENAKELVSELQLQFNKSRQAAITSELLDIGTAIMAQSQKTQDATNQA